MRSVLFLCVANSARSQMAEGLARHMLDPAVRVQSAGSQPTELNPLAIEAMAEIGIDISGQHSKSLADIDLAQVDIIVTLCAEEICPVVSGQIDRRHWPIPDPAKSELSHSHAQKLAQFRAARDAIRLRLIKEFDNGL